jgi:hypothetical protein
MLPLIMDDFVPKMLAYIKSCLGTEGDADASARCREKMAGKPA